MDPDAEFWKKLKHSAQGLLSVAEYVHRTQHCFNGITLLPGETVECIRCVQDGLTFAVHRLTVTAPFYLGTHGKW